MTDKIIILVTCGTAGEAERIARALVRNRLAACVNVLKGGVLSIYRWRGKVENAQEHLLLIKTARKHLPAVRWQVERLHSYEVPEIVALPIEDGSPAYLAWLQESVRATPPAKHRRAPVSKRRSHPRRT